MTRAFQELSPKEVLALAIHVERANSRRFRAFADVFRGFDEDIASRFALLATEEDQHEAILVERFRKVFGKTIPVVDEMDVHEVIESVDLDDGEHLVFDTLTPTRVYELALAAEQQAEEFYRLAASTSENHELAALYSELLEMEGDHAGWLERKLAASHAPPANTEESET